MKKVVFLLTGITVMNPLFKNMVLVCDDKYQMCNWDCRYDPETKKVLQNGNWVTVQTGCKDQPKEDKKQPIKVRLSD